MTPPDMGFVTNLLVGMGEDPAVAVVVRVKPAMAELDDEVAAEMGMNTLCLAPTTIFGLADDVEVLLLRETSILAASIFSSSAIFLACNTATGEAPTMVAGEPLARR